MKNKFYVYVYLRANRQSPYYVGKGAGKRINSKKHAVPLPPKERRVKIKEHLTEEEALELEEKLILFWGRKCEGGVLRNWLSGGVKSSRESPWSSKPCVWEGVSYPSQRAAAKALGINHKTISKWLKKGTPRVKGRRVPVEWEGVTYPSVAAAARALGLPINTLVHRIKKNKRLA